jgi:hypothetical protein
VDIAEALRITHALADGLNPATGEPCASDAVLRDAQVAIALHRAIGALESLAEREKARLAQAANAGRYWSKPEDAQVCEELRQGLDFQQIAKKHNRSVPSIVARLIKLGKIVPKSAPLFPEKVAS